jgi:restriction system protein
MLKSTIKEAIIAVLQKEGIPLSIKTIYDKIIEYDFYRFKAERPLGIVAVEIRRHCKGVEFPSASQKKHYQILNDGKYWFIDIPIPEHAKFNELHGHKTVKKDFEVSWVKELKELHIQFLDNFKKVVLSQLKEVEPRTFESFSKKLLEVYGFREMEVTQYSKDGGIDGYGKLKVGITYLNVAFQCKRWRKNNVSRTEIDKFRGAIQGEYEQGIIFTTASFSKESQNATRKKGAVPIILIDGNTIIEIMIEKNFGIEIENLPIYINALDRALTEEI